MTPAIRPGRDTDGPDLIGLIAACWSAYPCVRMDVDGEMPELHALATYYAGKGGALLVAEADGRLAGMIATRPAGETEWEICRVYVAPSLHGAGLAHALLDRAESHAIQAGAQRLFLWSDTRFDRAHRFYEKRSYVRQGPVRVLHDISNSLEYGYFKPVSGIETLDIAAAESAARRLSEILVTCVNAGSSLSFLAPMNPDKARAFWVKAARQVGEGNRAIAVGWCNGVIVAVGTLDLAMAENQPHLAEVQKIMVEPSTRRLGFAKRILDALEHAARAAGRSLLILDTRANDAGEALYHAQGWHEYGRLADHALDPAGRLVSTVFFAKRI